MRLPLGLTLYIAESGLRVARLCRRLSCGIGLRHRRIEIRRLLLPVLRSRATQMA
jgi:hypothetical protein